MGRKGYRRRRSGRGLGRAEKGGRKKNLNLSNFGPPLGTVAVEIKLKLRNPLGSNLLVLLFASR